MTPSLFVAQSFTLIYKKESDMNKNENLTIMLWGLLALIALVSAFFIPVLWVKIVNLIFGGLNFCVILSWVTATISARREYKKQSKLKEERENVQL